ncbi:putative transcription factor C2H2 family [Medicago truncatula]|uniref:Putative transcription factor C2H2 family n=1 Tax=Medicago truncatula TaxID=3880 RepID=A0A396JKH3_MEDTR|nr:putative transcription factor C2H2 family [Medicago truncatula]
MNKHYSSPSSHHSFDKPKNSHDHDHQQSLENDKKNPGSRIYSCEFCHKTFTSSKSLGGHKTIHRSSKILVQPETNKQIHDHDVNNGGTLKKTIKITCVFSSSLHNHDHDDGKPKNHTCDVCNKVFLSNNALKGHMRWHTPKGLKKGTIIHSPTAQSSLEQSHLEFLLATDLSKYLPPISYKTKKRSPRRRRIADNDEEITIAAKTLLYLSHGGYEGSTKRQKISSNTVDDNEKMKEQGVLLTRCVCHNEKNLVLKLRIPKDTIFQTSQDSKEPAGSNLDIEGMKNVSKDETELGSRVVRNVDLNELPSDDFEDENN